MSTCVTNMSNSGVIEDLELLTGKLIRGDITPIVYDMIKDSGYLELFVSDYLDYMSDEEKKNVSEQNINNDSSEDTHRGFSFEEWLASEGEPVTVRRKIR